MGLRSFLMDIHDVVECFRDLSDGLRLWRRSLSDFTGVSESNVFSDSRGRSNSKIMLWNEHLTDGFTPAISRCVNEMCYGLFHRKEPIIKSVFRTRNFIYRNPESLIYGDEETNTSPVEGFLKLRTDTKSKKEPHRFAS